MHVALGDDLARLDDDAREIPRLAADRVHPDRRLLAEQRREIGDRLLAGAIDMHVEKFAQAFGRIEPEQDQLVLPSGVVNSAMRVSCVGVTFILSSGNRLRPREEAA